MLYSASTNSFFDAEVNSVIPADAVKISREKWKELLDGQSKGRVIKPGADGLPVAVFSPLEARP